MTKFLLNSLRVCPAIVGAAFAVSTSAIAANLSPTAQSTAAGSEQLQPQAQSQSQPQVQSPAVAPAALVQPEAATVAPAFAKPATLDTPTQQPVVAQPTIAQPTIVAQSVPSVSSMEQVNRYSREGRSVRTANQMGQVTSVSQLTDVRPTDWAFQALQSLVERYGCIVGYPDRTYRGNQALTRFEFAAGLNACLDRVSELISAATTDFVRKEDLDTLRRLQEEFAAELATLRGRVDALEARTATLEKQQFSTTTKLAGEVIFGVTQEFEQDAGNQPVFQDRVRLSLNTSFTGKDLLITRLAAGNVVGFNTSAIDQFPGSGINNGFEGEATQSWQAGSTGNNRVFVDWVAYFTNLFDDKLRVYIPAVGGLHYDYTPTLSPALDAFDGGTGPLSYFGQRNPIYAIGGGTGIGLAFKLSDNFTISAGYLADNTLPTSAISAANDPREGGGLFNGSYSAMAQVAFTGNNFGIAATYVNAFRREEAIFNAGVGGGLTGTALANLAAFRTEVNAGGVSGYFKFGNNFTINAFGMFANVDAAAGGFSGDDGEIWSYGIGLAVSDLLQKGSLLGIVAGVQPYLGNSAPFNNDVPLHIEGFYKYQLNDNISITPGVIFVTNPGQNEDNNNILIGTLRTTFTF